MPSNRRQFLKQSALGAVLEARAKQTRPPSGLSLSPYALPKFVDPLAVPSLAKRGGSVPWPETAGLHVPYFHVIMQEFQAKVHRDLPPTTFWGYDGCSPVVAPEPHENGMERHGSRDVHMTRGIVRFEGFTGRYVRHCHVLEHEDNEMMRPFEVVAG
ncbi:MAG TPA: multicopper oxidase domain-containing protein [Bryobacteraceae bacterium]